MQSIKLITNENSGARLRPTGSESQKWSPAVCALLISPGYPNAHQSLSRTGLWGKFPASHFSSSTIAPIFTFQPYFLLLFDVSAASAKLLRTVA